MVIITYIDIQVLTLQYVYTTIINYNSRFLLSIEFFSLLVYM